MVTSRSVLGLRSWTSLLSFSHPIVQRSRFLAFKIRSKILSGDGRSIIQADVLPADLIYEKDNPFFTSTATSTNYNNRRPYGNGQLANINIMQSNGTAAYHSLQISARKVMAKHLSITAFYTFSKSLSSYDMSGQSTSGGAQDFRNLALEHGRSTYDQRHNFVGAFIWDISYYGGTNSLLKHVLNGWTLSPIITLSSGLPFTVTSGRDNNYDGNNNDRANLVGNPYLDPDRDRSAVVTRWFNTTVFVQNAIGTDGNTAQLHG